MSSYDYEHFADKGFDLKLTPDELKGLVDLFDSLYRNGQLPASLESVRTDLHTHLMLFHEKKEMPEQAKETR